MLYDLQADALTTLNRADQANRLREEVRQRRLAREAMAGRQERNTNLVSRLVDWARMLVKPGLGISPERSK